MCYNVITTKKYRNVVN